MDQNKKRLSYTFTSMG